MKSLLHNGKKCVGNRVFSLKNHPRAVGVSVLTGLVAIGTTTTGNNTTISDQLQPVWSNIDRTSRFLGTAYHTLLVSIDYKWTLRNTERGDAEYSRLRKIVVIVSYI
jgi:hypothetical protein